MKRIRIFVLFLILLLLLCGCSNLSPADNTVHGGELLDSEKMSEIRSSVFGSDVTEQGTEEESSETGTKKDPQDNTSTAYWSESGSVWHLKKDCRYLKNAKEILTGTVTEAKESGKTKACSSCGSYEVEESESETQTATESKPNTDSEEQIVPSSDTESDLETESENITETESEAVKETVSETETETKTEITVELNSTEVEETENTVYWTEKGGVWHLTRDCRYIKNSTSVLSGTVEEAIESGKTKLCSACGK